jgi:GNAT superfamily N-acetyltransferase
MIIREFRPEDAAALARVSSETWQATYKGIVHEAFLTMITFEHQYERWQSHETSRWARNGGFVYVAEDEIGTVVGFASAGPVREHRGGPEFAGEIYAIYVHPTAQRTGAGRRLLQAAGKRLAEEGIPSMIVWALQENHPARGFYAKMGGVESGSQMIELGDHSYPEVGYGWRSTAEFTTPAE